MFFQAICVSQEKAESPPGLTPGELLSKISLAEVRHTRTLAAASTVIPRKPLEAFFLACYSTALPNYTIPSDNKQPPCNAPLLPYFLLPTPW